MKKIRTILITLCVLLCLAGCSAGQNQANVSAPSSEAAAGDTKEVSELKVHFLDVGQGLSILVQSDGHFLLYDGGDRTASSFVVAYLKKQGVEKLDYLIASHYDADHLNGLVGALNVFETERILGPDYTADSRVFRSFISKTEELGKEIEHPKPGDTFRLGNASFEVLAPLSTGYTDVNDYSLVIRLENQMHSFLIMGDAETKSETELLAGNPNLSCDVISIGHHGSATSTTKELLLKASPNYAVINCGVDNTYEHPHPETLNKLKAANIPIYRTDLQGTIIATSIDGSLTFETEKDKKESPSDTGASVSEEPNTAWEAAYILNRSSQKFHYPSCASVPKISEKNREASNLPRGELLEAGYTPCKICNP